MQREVISSVETVLKSAAYIRGFVDVGGSCDVMRASLPASLPWIRSLMIVGGDGRIKCATNEQYVGLDLSDRPYLIKARESRDFVFSDYILARPTNTPIVMAAYPVSAINPDIDAVVLAGVNLDWMSKIMSNLGNRPGVTAALVDSAGTVLAAPADRASLIGRPLDNVPLLSSIADKALGSNQPEGSLSFQAVDGSKRMVNFARIAGPSLAAIVIAHLGIAWCFGINALSYLAVIVGLSLMRVSELEAGARLAVGGSDDKSFPMRGDVAIRLEQGFENVGAIGGIAYVGEIRAGWAAESV